MGGVYQEEIFSINHEFLSHNEVESAKDYLNQHQPICTESDWWDSEVTITGFDSKGVAEHFYRSLINYVDNQPPL